MNLRKLAGLGAAASIALLPVLTPGANAAEQPELKVTATLDKPSYHPGDVVTVHITITNVGSVPAPHVTAGNTGTVIADENWGDLDPVTGDGVRIEPGETYHGTGTGDLVDDLSTASFTLVVRAQDASGDADWSDNEVSLTAPYIHTKASFGGTVFADRNGNHAPDDGEGVPGVELDLSNSALGNYHSAVTDGRGRFLFDGIPTGTYRVTYLAPSKYSVPADAPRQFTVDDDNPDAAIELTPSFRDLVHASAKFVPGHYRAGDQVHVTVTLTNSGAQTYRGIKSLCGTLTEPNRFDPSRHSAFTAGDGVTLEAGATKTFDMWDTLPADAVKKGKVVADCWFGPDSVRGEERVFVTVSYSLTSAPQPQGSATPGGALANTGVGVFLPALGGTALLGAGLVLLVVARRRRLG